MSIITVAELALWHRSDMAFSLLDVRRRQARLADGNAIPGAEWFDPALWLDWKDRIPTDKPAVLYCVYGHEISQGLAAALNAMGIDARHLVGGIEAWKAAEQPVYAVPNGWRQP